MVKFVKNTIIVATNNNEPNHSLALITKVILLTLVSVFHQKLNIFYTPEVHIVLPFLLIIGRVRIIWIILYSIIILLIYHKAYVVQLHGLIAILLSFYLCKNINIGSSYKRIFIAFVLTLILSHCITIIIYFALTRTVINPMDILEQLLVDFCFYNIAYLILRANLKL